jgi:RimJ/RimL family protein N-acetyltransferase
MSYLDSVIASPSGSRVAITNFSEIVGLASLMDSGKGWADLGVVVEDRWQRLGIGRRLVGELLAGAGARDVHLVKAEVLATNAALLRPLRRVDHELCLSVYGETVEATLRICNRETRSDTKGARRAM